MGRSLVVVESLFDLDVGLPAKLVRRRGVAGIMVTEGSDFHGTLDKCLVGYLRLLVYFRAQRWKDVHTISQYPETVLGAMALRWLPTPTKSTLAALSDGVESQGDPELVRGFAALLQRATVSDPELRSSMFEMASEVEQLGRFDPGCAGDARQVHDELDRLVAVAAGNWTTPAEVLGVESHAHPEDLLSLAWSRLTDGYGRGSWCELLTVIHKLRPLARALRRVRLSEEDAKNYEDHHMLEQVAWVACWALREGLDLDDLPVLKRFLDDLKRRWPQS